MYIARCNSLMQQLAKLLQHIIIIVYYRGIARGVLWVLEHLNTHLERGVDILTHAAPKKMLYNL